MNADHPGNPAADSPPLDPRIEQQVALITKGASEVISLESLRTKIAFSLESGRPLVCKLGADPSAPDIHLGHTVVLTKLRHLQELGHQVVFLIGDFTGRIGDPTGRSRTRKPLTSEEVAANARTYQDQIHKILDPEKTTIRFNSEWLGSMSFSDVLELTGRYTIARLLERDDFHKRYTANHPIGVHELMYPLMQGYDSVALRADIELGATDQKFNLLVGRDLQKSYGQPSQVCLIMPILEGLDGVQKMSKSLGNYIGVDEPPEDMFGKLMSISDKLMWNYYNLLSDRTPAEIEEFKTDTANGTRHPMELKFDLAHEVTVRFQGLDGARRGREHFESVVRRKDVPDEMDNVELSSLEGDPIWVVRIIQVSFGLSAGESIRMIKQGAVKLDGLKIEDKDQSFARSALTPGMILQVGKRRFARLK